MPLPVPLALEAERLVQAERRLVPREDVELELADARLARPRDGLLEQHASRLPRGDGSRRPSGRGRRRAGSPGAGRARARAARRCGRRPRRRTRPRPGWRWIVRRYRRSSETERHGPVPRIQRPSSRPTLSASSTSACASPGVARRTTVIRRRSRRRRAAGRPPPRGRRRRRRCTAWTPPKKRLSAVPAVHVPARGKRRDVGVRPAALEVERRALDVQARRADRIRDVHRRAGSATSPARSRPRAGRSRRSR